MGTKKYLKGQVFGALQVIDFSSEDQWGNYFWWCLCTDCGNYKEISGARLLTSKEPARTCGCSLAKRNAGNTFSRIYATKEESMWRQLYRNYAYDQRGFGFELTYEQYVKLCQLPCHYCDAEPKLKVLAGNNLAPVKANGIDRKNSLLGYVLENCLPCCEHCNRLKLDFSYEEFLDKIFKIEKTFLEKQSK